MFADLSDADVEALRRDLAAPMRAAVLEVTTIDDPADVERCGFGLASTLALAPPRMVTEMLAMAAGEEHGDLLLGAMATAASPPVSRLAADVLGRTPASGLALERAHMVAFGQSMPSVIVTATRPGADGIQIFLLAMEQPLTGGAVINGFASSMVGPDEFDAMLRDAAGAEQREVEPAEALDLVVAGARRCVEHEVGPVEDALLAVNLLVRAAGIADGEELLEALAALPSLPDPAAAEDEEEQDDDDDPDIEIQGMAVALEAWCEANDEERELVVEAGVAMAQFRSGDRGGLHTPWTDDDVAEFLLGYVPRKVSVAPADLERFPAAVAQVFRFLSDCGRMRPRAALDRSATAVELTPRFAEAAADPANFGPAKALVGAMLRDGVDMGDDDAVATWIKQWNALPTEDRMRLPMSLAGPGPEVVHASRPAGAERAAARKAARRSRRRNRRR